MMLRDLLHIFSKEKRRKYRALSKGECIRSTVKHRFCEVFVFPRKAFFPLIPPNPLYTATSCSTDIAYFICTRSQQVAAQPSNAGTISSPGGTAGSASATGGVGGGAGGLPGSAPADRSYGMRSTASTSNPMGVGGGVGGGIGQIQKAGVSSGSGSTSGLSLGSTGSRVSVPIKADPTMSMGNGVGAVTSGPYSSPLGDSLGGLGGIGGSLGVSGGVVGGRGGLGVGGMSGIGGGGVVVGGRTETGGGADSTTPRTFVNINDINPMMSGGPSPSRSNGVSTTGGGVGGVGGGANNSNNSSSSVVGGVSGGTSTGPTDSSASSSSAGVVGGSLGLSSSNSTGSGGGSGGLPGGAAGQSPGALMRNGSMFPSSGGVTMGMGSGGGGIGGGTSGGGGGGLVSAGAGGSGGSGGGGVNGSGNSGPTGGGGGGGGGRAGQGSGQRGRRNTEFTPEDRKAALRQQQQRLLLLRHASKCPAEGEQCKVTPHCQAMKRLWKHIAECKNQQCPVRLMRSLLIFLHNSCIFRWMLLWECVDMWRKVHMSFLYVVV